MQRKNDSTILILIAAGLGIYWYMRNKSNAVKTIPTDQPLAETGFPPNTGGNLDIVYEPLAETGFPPNTGGNFDMVYNPVGRGGGYMTDMFESILDTTRNIDKDRMYEK